MTALLLLTLTAGQYPPGYVPPPPQGYLPNFYNRMNQPLSPYLNLLRGGNPGVNYYYGVRPGLPTGGMPAYQGGAAQGYGPQQFLPQSSTVVDPGTGQTFEPGGKEVVLRNIGRPVIYGNTFNGHGSYFTVYAQNINRGGSVAGPRNGSAGLGASRPRR
jgi:hypothetical protein